MTLNETYHYGEGARRWSAVAVAVRTLDRDGAEAGHTTVYATVGARGQTTYTVATFAPGAPVPTGTHTFPTVAAALDFAGIPGPVAPERTDA